MTHGIIKCFILRTNCYIASLNDTDLPTPDTFLSALSVTTKQSIKKLGLFTASVTYAFICENTTHSNQQFILKNSLFAALKVSHYSVCVTQHSDSLGLTRLKYY